MTCPGVDHRKEVNGTLLNMIRTFWCVITTKGKVVLVLQMAAKFLARD